MDRFARIDSQIRADRPILGNRFPDLPFLAFFWKSKENHPKKQGLFLYFEPLNSLGKKGKTLKKARKFVAAKKSKESQKSKESKIRVRGSRTEPLFFANSPSGGC